MNLNQVTVPCNNIPKSIEFYKKLGLKLIVHTHNYYARFECPDGESTFSLHYSEELPKGEGVWIYFEVAEVSNTVQELESKGIIFETQPIKQPWLWTEASLKDPNGNKIIIYHAGENRKNPPWQL
ncbi:MAG: VOC family protein [Flavobacteriaceae bacterium]|nr:VOC family protein [Flavobacteriaceae bacterium]